MQTRPFFAHSFDQLEAISKEKWNDEPALKQLLEELGFRTKTKPRQLRDKVSKRLDELAKAHSRSDSSSNDASAAKRLQELELLLKKQAAELQEWKVRCARAEAANARAADPMAALYAQIWLTSDCPDFILDAVRRTLRKRHHPDHAPPAEKARAEEQFKKYENIFDRIIEVRK